MGTASMMTFINKYEPFKALKCYSTIFHGASPKRMGTKTRFWQLLTACVLILLSLSGGCAPTMLVPSDLPPDQRALIRGSFSGAVFAGAQIIAVDGEPVSSSNTAYIAPGTHTVKLQYNRPGGGGPVGPIELKFEAAPGKEYRAKWHYSWSESYYYFTIEDAETDSVIVRGGETQP